MLTMGYQHADYEYQQQAGYSPNWMPGYNANPVCLPGYLSSYAQSAYQARKAQHAYKWDAYNFETTFICMEIICELILAATTQKTNHL